MINIDRINRISNEKREEYIACLRDFNNSFKEAEQAAMEAIRYCDVSEEYLTMNQAAMEGFPGDAYAKIKSGAGVVGDKIKSGANAASNAIKSGSGTIVDKAKELAAKTAQMSGALKESTKGQTSAAVTKIKGLSKKQIGILAAAAVGVVIIAALTRRIFVKFFTFGEKAKTVFKKFEEVIVPGKDSIDPEAFKAGKAKLLTVEKYQVLFKTAGDVTKLIKGFTANYATKPITWKADQFKGMDFVTKTDKNGVEVIKDIKLAKDYAPVKTTIGEAGWELGKAFKLAPVIKAIIETTMEFKRLEETFKAEESKLNAMKKSLKSNPDEQAKVIAQMLLIKTNLADFNHVLKAYFQLIGVVCGQFFTLTAHMKVKKA